MSFRKLAHKQLANPRSSDGRTTSQSTRASFRLEEHWQGRQSQGTLNASLARTLATLQRIDRVDVDDVLDVFRRFDVGDGADEQPIERLGF
jgi:hypothetical protein